MRKEKPPFNSQRVRRVADLPPLTEEQSALLAHYHASRQTHAFDQVTEVIEQW